MINKGEHLTDRLFRKQQIDYRSRSVLKRTSLTRFSIKMHEVLQRKINLLIHSYCPAVLHSHKVIYKQRLDFGSNPREGA